LNSFFGDLNEERSDLDSSKYSVVYAYPKTKTFSRFIPNLTSWSLSLSWVF